MSKDRTSSNWHWSTNWENVKVNKSESANINSFPSKIPFFCLHGIEWTIALDARIMRWLKFKLLKLRFQGRFNACKQFLKSTNGKSHFSFHCLILGLISVWRRWFTVVFVNQPMDVVVLVCLWRDQKVVLFCWFFSVLVEWKYLNAFINDVTSLKAGVKQISTNGS